MTVVHANSSDAHRQINGEKKKEKKKGEEERRAVHRRSNPPRIEADFFFFFPRVALSREIKSIPRSLDLSLSFLGEKLDRGRT